MHGSPMEDSPKFANFDRKVSRNNCVPSLRNALLFFTSDFLFSSSPPPSSLTSGVQEHSSLESEGIAEILECAFFFEEKALGRHKR